MKGDGPFAGQRLADEAAEHADVTGVGLVPGCGEPDRVAALRSAQSCLDVQQVPQGHVRPHLAQPGTGQRDVVVPDAAGRRCRGHQVLLGAEGARAEVHQHLQLVAPGSGRQAQDDAGHQDGAGVVDQGAHPGPFRGRYRVIHGCDDLLRWVVHRRSRATGWPRMGGRARDGAPVWWLRERHDRPGSQGSRRRPLWTRRRIGVRLSAGGGPGLCAPVRGWPTGPLWVGDGACAGRPVSSAVY